LIILPDRIKTRERVKDSRNIFPQQARLAEHGIIFTIRFVAFAEIVGPADVIRVQQISQVGPGIVQFACIGRLDASFRTI
jgi:hypothetical protein